MIKQITQADDLPIDVPDHYLNRGRNVFIHGTWRKGNETAVFPLINPSTGEIVTNYAAASLHDVDDAIVSADQAFSQWRRLSGHQRADYLRGFAHGLRSRQKQLVQLQMLNNGKPRIEAEIDLSDAITTFEYYARLAEQLDERQGSAVSLNDPHHTGSTFYEPLGPAALIVPWNFPLVTSAWKLGPALAAGCSVILKPSEFTTAAELVYGDIALEIGLPAGVLNILPGKGDVGAAICSHPLIRKISFTGSNQTGSAIMALAARRNVPLSLELGGKSPIVIMDDADINKAVDIIAAGIFYNCGQMCSASSRLIVHDKLADDIIMGLLDRLQLLVVDGPENPDAEMGPLTTKPQFQKVQNFLAQAKSDGIDFIAGGQAYNDRKGFFVKPTICYEPDPKHFIWREELFGPILSIKKFSTQSEAIELANDTEFGLAATVVGCDQERINQIVAHIDAGHIWVNTAQVIYPNATWGGFKASGIGRELGPWGLSAYSAPKHVTYHT